MFTISNYLRAWRVKLSVNKTVASVFHLRNHMANYKLEIKLNDSSLLKFETNPKYLGVCLDRSLTFKSHINHLKSKVTSRVALIKHLANVKWGASFNAIRTSAMALVYAPAEYCASAWCRSVHTHKADVPLNEAMRTITGCLRATPFNLLPCLSGIPPPNIRRNNLSGNVHTKAEKPDHPLHQILHGLTVSTRLKSRKLLRPFIDNLILSNDEPSPIPTQLEPFTDSFSTKPPGCHLPRKEWVQLNRLRTGVGRFAANMVKMGLSNNILCSCGEIQTAFHILNNCPTLRPPCHNKETTNDQLRLCLSSINF